MSTGAAVLGLLNGMTIGLLAVGLVLVYKSNRFINLAHTQLGALPAMFVAKLVVDAHWNFWVALLVSVLFGVGTGLAVERFFVRAVRERSTSALPLLLLTVGISQLLLAFTYVPAFGLHDAGASLYPQPFESRLRVGGVVLTGMSVLTLLLIPALVIGLAVFLKRSSLGKQVRAAANNPSAARLCGVSVDRVSSITWAIAGGLAAVSAILAAPTQAGFSIASLGPYLLMLTLGAAAFGAFVSLPAALVGGLVLGMVGQLVAAQTNDASKSILAVFATMLVVIALRGRAIGRVFATVGAAVPELPATRVPAVLRGSPLVRLHRRGLIAFGLAFAFVLPLVPAVQSEGDRFFLVLVVVNAIVGVSLTMLVGWGGMVSLGQVAVVGVGAFTAARLAPHGWTLPSLLLAGGLAGALALTVVGLPAVRVPGFALAVSTLGLAVIAPRWLFHQPWIGTPDARGLLVDAPVLPRGLGALNDQLSIYYAGVVVLALALAAGWALRRSAPGRLVVAVRDNERASAAFGIAPARVKISLLAISGFFAGAAGVLWAAAWRVVSVDHFGPDASIAILAVPVVGGLGSLAGAVAAAALLYLPTFFIGPLVAGLFGDFGRNVGFLLFLSGTALIGTVRNFPTGIAGLAQRAWQSYLDRRAATLGEAPVDRVASDLAVTTTRLHERGPAWRPSSMFERRIARLIDHESNGSSGAIGDGVAALDTTGVRVSFGGVVALDGADLRVESGEIVGLIGPNGAGKTTLLNVVSGVLAPAAGSVRLFGSEVVDLPTDLRAAFGLARTFQDALLFPGLTVRETVQVALARRHMVGFVPALVNAPWVRAADAATAADAETILERFGLTSWADARTVELSTGTRRICDIAAQVATRPRILIMDEPTGGVAQREAEAFGPLIRRIRDELGCSILIVEHDMPLLMGLCDRVCAMDAGRVIAEGTAEEMRSNPLVIASYLGTDDVAISRSGSANGKGSERALAGAGGPSRGGNGRRTG